jgi:hypothetical protein
MGYDSFRQLWISGFNRSLDCTIDQPSFGRRIYKKSSAEIAQVRRLLTTLGQHQKSINGGLSEVETQHQQFATDPRCAPSRCSSVGSTHEGRNQFLVALSYCGISSARMP